MIYESEIMCDSGEFLDNSRIMQERLDELNEVRERLIGNEEKARPKFEKRGQLLPRERLGLLLDPGSPFVEICPLAGYQMYGDKDGSSAGGGLITGIGFIEGTRCLVNINNCAIKGGTINPAGLYKTLRFQEIAMRQNLPLVTLAQSGGANLNYATDVFVEGARSFANQARMSSLGIPQVTVVHGNATAGGAYQPGLSDHLVLVDGGTRMFLAGPPLLFAATGEIASDEELGGAALHAYESGTGEYLAKNDEEGILIARKIVRSFQWKSEDIQSRVFHPPRYNTEELLGIVPGNPKTPYDVREVFLRIFDESEYLEFKREFDEGTVCVRAQIFGIPCGVIGNNSPITHNGAMKASQFMQTCDQLGHPLIFLHNTTGFLVGKEAEASGIIKHGSKMIQAVTNVRVPKISLVIGGSFGAGNYAMCGRGMDPDFLFAWPNARTAVMGGEQAGKVLRIVSEMESKRRGLKVDEEAMNQLEEGTRRKLDAGSMALFSTARLWDDGLIDPRDTRRLLGFLLRTCLEAGNSKLRPNSFGVSRF